MRMEDGFITVEKGDTLGEIARSLGSSVKELMMLNPMLKDPDLIFEGQTLRAPPPPQGELFDEGMPPSKRLVEVIRGLSDAPVSQSKNATCCCKIAPWRVRAEGRGYILKLTERVQERALGGSGDVIVPGVAKEPPSNEESGLYELHIVSKEPNADGTPSFKSVIPEYEFIKPECNLALTAEHEITGAKKRLRSGEPLKIDADCRIAATYRGDEEAFEYIPHACIGSQDPYAVINELKEEKRFWEGRRECAYDDTIYGIKRGGDAEELSYAKCREVVADLKLKELEKRFESVRIASENPTLPTDALSLLALLFHPSYYERILLYPSGSSKCDRSLKAVIKAHPFFKIDGSVKLGMSGSASEKEREAAAEASLKIARGSKSLTVGYEANLKPGAKADVCPADTFFGPLAKSIRKIYKASAAAERVNGYRNGKESLSFDPGMTSFEFGAEDLRLCEDPNGYGVHYTGKAVISLAFFDGAKATLDLIPYVIGMGGPVAKVVEKAIRQSKKSLSKTSTARALSKHLNGDIRLDLSIGGSASGTLELEFREKETVSSTGSVSGRVEFEVLGLVESGLDAFGIEVGAGAGFKSGSAKSPKAGTDITCSLSITQAGQGEMPTFDGDIATDGLAIYYAWYAYAEYISNDKNKNTGGRDGLEGNDTKKITQTLTFKESDRITLIEPFSFIDEIQKRFPKEQQA